MIISSKRNYGINKLSFTITVLLLFANICYTREVTPESRITFSQNLIYKHVSPNFTNGKKKSRFYKRDDRGNYKLLWNKRIKYTGWGPTYVTNKGYFLYRDSDLYSNGFLINIFDSTGALQNSYSSNDVLNKIDFTKYRDKVFRKDWSYKEIGDSLKIAVTHKEPIIAKNLNSGQPISNKVVFIKEFWINMKVCIKIQPDPLLTATFTIDSTKRHYIRGTILIKNHGKNEVFLNSSTTPFVKIIFINKKEINSYWKSHDVLHKDKNIDSNMICLSPVIIRPKSSSTIPFTINKDKWIKEGVGLLTMNRKGLNILKENKGKFKLRLNYKHIKGMQVKCLEKHYSGQFETDWVSR